MLFKILKNRVLLSILAISFIIIGTLFFYIPKFTEQNTIDTIVKNSKNAVEQIKLTRSYYVQSVVSDVKNTKNELSFGYDHKERNGVLPFPTTVIHDLGEIYSNNTGIKFQLYSNYPFKPKEKRELTASQKEALTYIEDHDSGMWVKRDTIDGKEVLRVAVADYMTEQACVSCHNSHPDKTWEDNKWEMGDKRGLLEVITPIDDDLAANHRMRDKILVFIGLSMLIIIILYTTTLLQREEELLNENDILDKKVEEEIAKNRENEKLLILQNRSASMGEMMNAIIHQWKQPLNAISLSNSSMETLMEIDQLDRGSVIRNTSSIKQQIENMDSTLYDFSNFFKPQEKKAFDINYVINNVYKLIANIYLYEKVNILLEKENHIFVEGYENELSQVLINILNNARDNIIEKDSKVREIIVKTYTKEDKAIIEIKDSAGGIPENIIDKIFEPYFSTKKHKGGTGIGLDMSRTIIEKAKGTIKVENSYTTYFDKEYKGALFTIELNLYKNS